MSVAIGAYRNPAATCFAAALVFLPVGGVGLLQSRLGMTPLGYGEPIVLLVAVHFHYAAFVSPIMAGAVLTRTATGEPLKRLVGDRETKPTRTVGLQTLTRRWW